VNKKFDYFRWFVVAVLVVLGWVNYQGMIRYTMFLFTEPPEDMSHGWIVPFVSIYVLWTQRKALKAAAGLPSWGGFIWACFFLAIAWFGGRGGQSRVEQLSLIGLIWSSAYALWGRQTARLMLFPAGYLVFTIPISSFTDFFTIHLRILSSSLAMWLLNGFGVAVEQAGTALFSRVPGSEFNVDVADPCSGIRSLFAMMALIAGYAYYTQKTVLGKSMLFACSVPIAMIGNIARILSICLMATWFGQDIATGYYHDYSGYIVFLVGVLLMIQAGEAIQRGELALGRRGIGAGWFSATHSSEDMRKRLAAGVRHYFMAGLVLLAVAGVFTLKAVLPAPAYITDELVTSSLPEQLGSFVGDTPWYCHNDQCLNVAGEEQLRQDEKQKKGDYVCPACGGKLFSRSLGEKWLLPKETTVLKRTYRSPEGISYAVTVVVSGWHRASIHRPELCLPSQGYVMTKAKRMAVQVTGGAPKEVRQIRVQREGEAPMSLAYWFFSRERESCSHVERILTDIWDRSVHNRVNRWAMVTVNACPELASAESLQKFEEFLSALCPAIILNRQGL